MPNISKKKIRMLNFHFLTELILSFEEFELFYVHLRKNITLSHLDNFLNAYRNYCVNNMPKILSITTNFMHVNSAYIY